MAGVTGILAKLKLDGWCQVVLENTGTMVKPCPLFRLLFRAMFCHLGGFCLCGPGAPCCEGLWEGFEK